MAKMFSKVFCVLLGAALGPAACGDPNIDGNEYGMPHARYNLDGKVISATDESPIKGIQVRFDRESVLTEDDGTWAINAPYAWPCHDECSLEVRDIDGPENGEFEDKTVALNPTRTAEGSNFLYHGEFEQNNIKIRLEEKQPE